MNETTAKILSDTPDEFNVRRLILAGEATKTSMERIVERSVRQYALPYPLTTQWAALWLSGKDRTATSDRRAAMTYPSTHVGEPLAMPASLAADAALSLAKEDYPAAAQWALAAASVAKEKTAEARKAGIAETQQQIRDILEAQPR